MPKNKNAYLRYRIIDECLRNKNKYFNRDSLSARISERLGYYISMPTVDKDLRAMKEEFNAPIVYDKIKNRYYYSKNFTLSGFELDEDEERALHSTLSMLDILKDTKYAKSIKGLIQKLITQAKSDIHHSIIEFEQQIVQINSDIFDAIYNAIKNKEALIITYQAYGKDRKDHMISPYMIKEYRNRFYLVARKHTENKKQEWIYCFGIDRIKDVKKTNFTFINTEGFDSKNYFKNSFGITRKLYEEPMELVLKFNKINSPYILSKPLHQSQKIINQTKDYLIVSIKVYESFELNMAILGYGAGVEVISPHTYVKYIKGVINDMKKIYRS